MVPCPAPSLSTASQPLLVPQLYRKSRRVVLSRAIDLSYFAGRAAPGPGRAGPALHPDGTAAVPGLVRDVSASPKAARSRQRIARSPPPAALPDAAQRWRGAAAPLQQLLRRGAARRRARAHSVDGWTTVYDQDGRPRAMPDELVGAPANRCCALLRQHDEPPYTMQPQKRAARDEGVAHTHYRHTTSATRHGRHERSGRHTSNLYATARLQIAPSPDRGAGDGTAFSLTATARPRDGGTVAAVYTWNSQSMDGPSLRPKGVLYIKGPRPGCVWQYSV